MYIDFTLKVDEEFIRNNQDQFDWVNWVYVSEHAKMSENFIREFKDKVNWEEISCHQKLSENFIREFQDKINWDYISYYQKLSEDFIREFKYKINWDYLLEKYGYELNDKYQIKSINYNFQIVYDDYISYYAKIVSDNYCSDYLLLDEFKKLALRLISLKAFQ